MGLEVQITEMAVRNFDKSQADRHAAFYGDLFTMFTELNQNGENPLKAVSIWGLTDYPQGPKGNVCVQSEQPLWWFGG